MGDPNSGSGQKEGSIVKYLFVLLFLASCGAQTQRNQFQIRSDETSGFSENQSYLYQGLLGINNCTGGAPYFITYNNEQYYVSTNSKQEFISLLDNLVANGTNEITPVSESGCVKQYNIQFNANITQESVLIGSQESIERAFQVLNYWVH